MQVELEDPPTMTEQRIDLAMLTRIDGEQKATATRVENLDKTLHGVAREVSEIKGILKTAETPSWIRFYIYPTCVLISAAMVAAVITLLVKVNGIEAFIHNNGEFISSLRLKSNSSTPSDPHSIQDVKLTISQAQKEKIRIPVEAVTEAGVKFVEASGHTPEAWSAALALVQYKSFLLQLSQPVLAVGSTIEGTHYRIPPTNELTPIIWLAQSTLGSKAPDIPEVHALDSPDMNSGVKVGPAFIVINGGSILLDGIYAKRVVFRDVHVLYKGGPVLLQNVQFLNCTFEVFPVPQGQDFAKGILTSSPSMDFNAS
jgi:hypothetical protein